MASIFDGLEKFGLSDFQSVNLYENKKSEDTKNQKAVEKNFSIMDYLYAKEFECPVCEKLFTANIVRPSKLRLVDIEYDLRPIYSPIDPLYYDNVVCTNCGYSAVKNYFNIIRSFQAELILKNITPKYTPVKYPDELSVNMAIDRYKLTLLNSYIKKGSDGEKAYICMKLSWLYRIMGDVENELLFSRYTIDGFTKAFSTDSFPIMGLEENTILYLLAAHSSKIGRKDEAMKHLGKVIVSKTASAKLKDRARDLKETISKL